MQNLSFHPRAVASRATKAYFDFQMFKLNEHNLFADSLECASDAGADPKPFEEMTFADVEERLLRPLRLAWPHAPPYPANTTVPGGMLRLTAEADGNVSAAFLYTTFDEDTGDMRTVDAPFAHGTPSMPLTQLVNEARTRIDGRCVGPKAKRLMVEEEPVAAVER